MTPQESHPKDIMFADGFEEAVIGIATTQGSLRVVYDQKRMAQILQQKGMSVEESWNYLDKNIFPADLGPGTPVFVQLGNYEQIISSLT